MSRPNKGKIVKFNDYNLVGAPINASSIGDNILIAADPANEIWVFKLILLVAAATVLIFKRGATALTGPITLAANGSMALDYDGEPWLDTDINEALIVNSSVAVQISGRLYYQVGLG